jgi:hypothetical protein
MQNKLITISFIFIFAFSFTAKGQKLINSPYSRFNIGTLEKTGAFRSLSMGGTGVAMRDNSSIYYVNPASYSSFDTISFLFDFGVDYSIIDLKSGTNKYRSDDMNFHHLIIGFPIGKGWGVAAGLVPLSNGYYNLSETIKLGDPGYDPLTGAVLSTHKGTGGFTNFFLGTGVNITKNISIGANLSVIFGQLERINQFEFGDYTNTFGQFNSEKLRINGANIEYGAQYTKAIKKDYFFTAGISLNSAKRYNSDFEKLAERFAAYTPSAYSPDTLYYSNTSSKDSTKLPSSIKAGIAFGKKDKFVASIDYISSNWADAKIHGSNGYLANSKSWLFGIEIIPDKLSNYSFLKRVEYRFGGHISDNYLLINGEQLKEYGASVGLGLRMRNTLSKTNIYFDFTRKQGNISAGMHDENYYSVGISLNLYDWWFMKTKYQ